MDEQNGQYKIVKRSTAVKWFIFIVVVIVLSILSIQDYMARYLEQQELLATHDQVAAAIQSLTMLRWICYGAGGFALIAGIYIARYGYRSMITGHFPALGSWLIEGRPVHTGKAARRLAVIQIGTGLLLIFIGIALVVYFHTVIDAYGLTTESHVWNMAQLAYSMDSM